MPFGKFGYLMFGVCAFFLLCRNDVHVLHANHGASTVPVVKDQLVMYATQSCGYCKKARNYMAQNDISYTERDLNADPTARQHWEALDADGVPFFTLNGKQMQGWSSRALEQFLNGS